MKSLLLTLGHNSSAIYIQDNKILWGYETERLSGLKSDSRFPMPFINKYIEMDRPDMVYVTHWAPDGNLSSMSQKHWDPSYFDGIPIRTLSTNCTHHDTHMAAAICYANINKPKTYGLVVDGFGTCGEHFSVYDLSNGQSKLIKRIHGYETSLGMWYQYATAFMGLKMHEDEYKLLGYEVHAPMHLVKELDSLAKHFADRWIEKMGQSIYGSKYDPLYDLDALANVKNNIFSHLTSICLKMDLYNSSDYESRCILAYYVQKVLENVVLHEVRQLNADYLILSGGVFYNVKLNKLLINEVEKGVCVYPLAGDQGNALGLYYIDHAEFVFPDNLNWGHRRFDNISCIEGLSTVQEDIATKMIMDTIDVVGYVNVVRGSMEFGPRALCNTSTIALPTLDSVRDINTANDRNTVMPMAPVMTMQMYRQLFENPDKLHKSYKHMICAMEYAEHPLNEMLGVAHEYNTPYHHHTGRPQVIDENDKLMQTLFKEFKTPLINTSFNFHGMPIAWGMSSIIKNHMMQHNRAELFTTVVITK
jgi:predicted NodU family carbamoyl transferase